MVDVAQEVIHRCKNTRSQGYILKLGFEKAYDSVNWDCLLEVLSLKRFGDKWISWIRSWLFSTNVWVLINRIPGKEILCKRGLRQGDLLSPFQFVLVADGMNKLPRKAEDSNLISGLARSNTMSFINLQYADDTLLFGNCDIKQAFILKWIMTYALRRGLA